MAKLKMITTIIMSGALIAGCSKGAAPVSTTVPAEPTVTERVNQFLSDQGITLPAGVARADLKDVAGGSSTGVVTMDKKGNTTTYSVLADLPAPTGGVYTAWLKDSTGNVVKLGNLKNEKGGYMVDYSTTTDDSSFKQVVVSQEKTTVTTPTTPVLDGSF